MRLNSVKGCYFPSFFTMFINTSDDISSALEKDDSDFVHEFVHYIQDLILPYNIRLNLSNLKIFHSICDYVKKHATLTRPFTDWDEETIVVLKQNEYTIGCNETIIFVNKIVSIEKDYFTDTSIPAALRVFRYKLNLITPTNEIQYHIGARDLLEYIAYKIHAKHYGFNPPMLPYKTVDLIFDYYNLSSVPCEVRLCVIEYCLYNDNPVHILFKHFLDNKHIENNISIFSDYDKCYEFLMKCSIISRGGFQENMFSKSKRRLENFIEYLTMQYNNNIFKEIKTWLEQANNFAKNNLSGRFIFSDIQQMNKNELFVFINYIINSVGLPLIINNQNRCSSLLPNKQDVSIFAQFHVLQCFLQSVEHVETSCPIYDFCKANGGDCDEYCVSNPIIKINDDERCPYMLFLNTYGIKNM